MSRNSSVFAEMKRRGVLQLLGIYIVGAWVVLQVADLAFESWGLADSALRFVWIGAFLIFPLAFLFSWRYDVTARGIVRTPPSAEMGPEPLQRIDKLLLGTMALACVFCVFVLVSRIAEEPRSGSSVAENREAADPNAIAVLPFATAGGAEDTVFLADGIHDEVLTTLANISSLKVISRTSVMQYRDSARNMRKIADELGAANILEGRVQRSGDNVRINVQLIDAETDEHVWAQIYDRALSIDNIFEIQSEMARTIAEQLAMSILPAERRRLDSQPTDNLEAFNAYIKGKHRFSRSSFEALWDSEKLFRQAIELDPQYAIAHFALGYTYVMLAYTGAITIEEAIESGTPVVQRGLDLDPASGYGQAVLATYQFASGETDFDDKFRYALELSPNSVEVRDIYAGVLRQQNRNEEALEIIKRALELDPLSVSLFHDLGRSHVALGQFEQAHAAFHRISQIDPDNPYATHGAAQATILGGLLAEAAYWSDETAKYDPVDFENPATSAFIYGSIGDLSTAQLRVDKALALGPEAPFPLAAQTYLLVLQGRRSDALQVARTALAMGVEDRWRSHMILTRVIRDEALRSGNYNEAIAWYEQLNPAVFTGDPQIDASNIVEAADGAHLLIAAGRQDDAERILNEVIRQYDELYALGAANYPLSIAKVDALILLGRNDEALDALEKLVDDHWRLIWRWCTEENPTHDSIRDNVRYQSLIEAIRDDLSQQVDEAKTARSQPATG